MTNTIAELIKSEKLFHGNQVDKYSFRRRYCCQCGRNTDTVFLPLSSGHVGNACFVCHCLRKGRPYLPKHYLELTPMPKAEGVHHEQKR